MTGDDEKGPASSARVRALEEALAIETRKSIRLATLLEHLPAGVLVQDEHRRVALANTRFCVMFGIPASPDTLVGADCAAAAEGASALFPEPGAFVARVDGVLAAGRPVLGERLETNDGRVFERDYLPVRDGAEPLGHVWSYRDVTEAARSVRELEGAKTAAERASATKARFLGLLGHEMRNPLSALLGLLQLGTMASTSADEREVALGRAQASARTILRLTEDILDFSLLDAGALRIDDAPYEPRRMTEGLVGTLELAARARGLRLHLRIAPDVPSWVSGDEQRIRQVLHNLIGNAVKLMERGQILVTLETGGAQRLRWSVRDEGPGIAPEALSLIFEPFEQLPAGRRAGGAGLGLSVSRGLVERMGGRIDVTSEVDRGSTFVVELPAPSARAGRASSSASMPRLGPAPTVLVVDDHEDNRFVLSRLLESAGLRVTTAESGARALECHARCAFDAIVTDHSMPEMDGPALTRAIRARERASGARRVRIVGVTAAATDDVRAACIEAGMDAWLSKPPSRSALVNAIISSVAESAAGAAGDPEVLARLPRYLARRRADAVSARVALEERRFEDLARLGHDLRGHGGSYGLPAISAIGDELELAARGADREKVAATLDALDAFLASRLEPSE